MIKVIIVQNIKSEKKKRKLKKIYKGGCEKINDKEKGIHQKKKGEIT